jgi:hypothetical protein
MNTTCGSNIGSDQMNFERPVRVNCDMDRRTFFAVSIGLVFGIPGLMSEAEARPPDHDSNLLRGPLELGGEWAGSDHPDVRAVITRMREACLSGVQLVSDRQPKRLRVDGRRSGPPHIWLDEKNPDVAWIILNVNVAARRWSQLAYQFGHELGHVLCNNWMPQSRPQSPLMEPEPQTQPTSYWLEEGCSPIVGSAIRPSGRISLTQMLFVSTART